MKRQLKSQSNRNREMPPKAAPKKENVDAVEGEDPNVLLQNYQKYAK